MFLGFDGVWSFNEGFAAVKKDGKWGYINTKGE
ncbi:WG repeat-containing protein [Campylobacter concisus]|nr:WG repeat-containing protein [Campylobacter concisus]